MNPGAGVVETHISVLTFGTDLVRKRKKPLRFSFVDQSTPELREALCHRELELNRRLAPEVYLGVDRVVNAAGELIDAEVVMRRMPDDRRLSHLVVAGDAVDEVRQVARTIASFHARLSSAPDVAAAGTQAATWRLWSDNFSELRPIAEGLLYERDIARAEALARRFVSGRQALFQSRIDDGRIVDGHGDLLADDVYCLEEGPQVLDCLEFDDRLRHGDVVADVAFLAMDLERLGRPDLARRFLDWYGEFSGEVHPSVLEHHWMAYRALVRCKVACLRAGQHAGPASVAAEEARRLLAMTVSHLKAAQVRVIVVGGLPGTGKSTLTDAIGAERGWMVLRSDEIRKDLAGLGHGERTFNAYRSGLYDPAVTTATYEEIFKRAGSAVAMGESVVLDASFSAAARRRQALELAAAHHALAVEVRCDAPPAVVAARLQARSRLDHSVSDADENVAASMASDSDPWPTATTVDTSAPVTELVGRLEAVLDGPRMQPDGAG